MSKLLNKKKLRTTVPYASAGTTLRMALIVGASLATLVAIPGWLRNLEIVPHHPDLEQAAEGAEVEVPQVASQVSAKPVSTGQQHQALADSLGKRYRVSKDALERFIHLAYTAGQMTKVDPLLILAVMAVESNFNPIAESVMGAKGLMQIIPEFHQDKLVGPLGVELNALDPEINILAGAKVLREYATKTGEDLVAALRLYGGTGPDPANPYPTKVLSERDRLQQVLRRASNSKEHRATTSASNS